MKKSLHIIGLALLFATSLGFGQEAMTPGRFRDIVNSPADAVPLVSQLAAVPLWTNAVVSNVMTYASGKVFSEEMTQTARTVGGRYVVFTVQSKFYNQPMNALLVFDEKTAALKTYGLYRDSHGDDMMTEGTVVYNYAKKTYTITSSFGAGFNETTTGSYTDTEDHANSKVYQSGALFMSREVVTRPFISKK
ncbi:MAG: hypothetical protein WCJ07_14855 [Verrucomicrobiota bacterium]